MGIPITYAEWSWSEYYTILRCALSGQLKSGPHLDDLTSELRGHYEGRQVLLVNSGRAALRLALQIARRAHPHRTEVVIPGYVCPSVPETVLSLGLTPVAADVGLDLNMSSQAAMRAIRDKTLALIAVHMYGCPAEIQLIERLCQDARILLVDDAAQVIGVKVGSRALGTYGDFGVVSFAQSKTIVAGITGAGGLLIVNRRELEKDALERARALRQPTLPIRDLLEFVWSYMLEAATYYPDYYFRRLFQRGSRYSKNAPSDSMLSNVFAALAIVQYRSLQRRIEGHIRSAEMYSRELAESDCVLPQFETGRYLTRLMVQLPQAVQASAIVKALRARGVGSRGAYHWIQSVGGGNRSYAEEVSRRLVELPFRADMSANQVRRVCRTLRRSVEEVLPTHENERTILSKPV